MMRLLDRTVGRWLRHVLFVLVRSYFAMFFNVGCAGKHLLQDAPGTLILATHVSRHDGPLIAAMLYSTRRIRPTVHYDEYYNWLQFLPMFISDAIPMSSPKTWPEARRQARKAETLDAVQSVLEGGNCVLLFPAGRARRAPQEVVPPHLTGARDILRARPDTPVMLLRIEGLGTFQTAQHDNFWTFLGIRRGRRHVSMDLRPLTGLDPTEEIEVFNASLESMLNTPISRAF